MKTLTLTSANQNNPANTRRWLLGTLVVIVLAFGWRYPLLGLMVPAVMLAGIAGGWFRGRYVCGNVCPRGAFLDSWLKPLAGLRQVPGWMRSPAFRGLVMTALMGFLGWRLAQNPGSLAHWGQVFWQMCLLTTLVAIALGIGFSERAWCAICPMGSLQAAEGRNTSYRLHISADCRACGLCNKSCPMSLEIAGSRAVGELHHHDCIKCGSCQAACPAAALSWPPS